MIHFNSRLMPIMGCWYILRQFIVEITSVMPAQRAVFAANTGIIVMQLKRVLRESQRSYYYTASAILGASDSKPFCRS